MNLRGGIAIIRGQLFGFFSAKGFFWTLAIGWMTGPVIYLLVWTAAAQSGAIGGYNRNDFILYYLCLILVNQMTYPTTHWSTSEAIHNGYISSAILRPLPVIYGAIGQELAVKIVCMPFVAIVMVLLGFLLDVQVSISLISLLTALIALVFALIIRFLLAYTISLLTFWTQQSGALLSVNDTFIFLFAGQVAPLALFPGLLKNLAYILPYRYMISFPVEVIIGKLSQREMWQGFAYQLFWMVVLIILHYLINKQGVKKYSAVGG